MDLTSAKIDNVLEGLIQYFYGQLWKAILHLVSTDELILGIFCIWKRFSWNSWDMQKADHKEIIPFRSSSLWWVSTANWIYLFCGGPPSFWSFIFTNNPAESNFHLRYRFLLIFLFFLGVCFFGGGGGVLVALLSDLQRLLSLVCVYSPIFLSLVGHRILKVDRESGVCSNFQLSNLGILGLPYWMTSPLETFYAT